MNDVVHQSYKLDSRAANAPIPVGWLTLNTKTKTLQFHLERQRQDDVPLFTQPQFTPMPLIEALVDSLLECIGYVEDQHGSAQTTAVVLRAHTAIANARKGETKK